MGWPASGQQPLRHQFGQLREALCPSRRREWGRSADRGEHSFRTGSNTQSGVMALDGRLWCHQRRRQLQRRGNEHGRQRGCPRPGFPPPPQQHRRRLANVHLWRQSIQRRHSGPDPRRYPDAHRFGLRRAPTPGMEGMDPRCLGNRRRVQSLLLERRCRQVRFPPAHQLSNRIR